MKAEAVEIVKKIMADKDCKEDLKQLVNIKREQILTTVVKQNVDKSK